MKLFDNEQKVKIEFSVYTIHDLPAFSELFGNDHYEPEHCIIKGSAAWVLRNLPNFVLEKERKANIKADKEGYILI